MAESDLQKALRELAKKAEKQAVDEIVDAQTRVVAGSFDRATAYTNALILAGYASFFGLWQLTKDMVSVKLGLWAALLMAVSASVFVLFEVTKTFFYSLSLNRLNTVLLGPAASHRQSLLQAFDEYNKHQQKWAIVLIPWWFACFAVSVVSGIGGVAILMWSFIVGLLAEQSGT